MSLQTLLVQDASFRQRHAVVRANRWRDGFNPLRALTIARAATLLEAGERGEYADLQWLYRFIEKRDATLSALITRRTSAVQEMGWDIKRPKDAELPRGLTPQQADDQVALLRTAYDRIDNLGQAIEFLELASFRGFAHLEKHFGEDGEVAHFEPVDQWHWVRDGLRGVWQYNADAASGANRGTEIDYERFLIREVDRPVNEIALIAFVRKSLSQKDWDGFIETFGIPPIFAEMPPNVPADQLATYLAMAQAVISDMRGALPSGAKIVTPTSGVAGTNPFEEHLRYQDELVVLAGTGGKLTMLAESGTGTLAGGAHSDTFRAIGKAEAAEISEIFQEQFDAELLIAAFPDQPHAAYFEIAAEDEEDIGALATTTAQFSAAGYFVDPGQLSERTGLTITIKPLPAPAAPTQVNFAVPPAPAAPTLQPDPAPAPAPQPAAPPVIPPALPLAPPAEPPPVDVLPEPPASADPERIEPTPEAQQQFLAAARALVAAARAEDLQPVREAVAELLQGPDEELPARLAAFREKLAALRPQLLAAPATTKAYEAVLGTALLNGIHDAAPAKR